MSFIDLSLTFFLSQILHVPGFFVGGGAEPPGAEPLLSETTPSLTTTSTLKYKIPTPPTPTKFPLRSPRGANLATRVWPVKKPRALFLIVHGGGWHSGYFQNLVGPLGKENIFCASYDQVNCGYSDPEPGAPPGVMHLHSFDCLVEDVVAAIEWIQKEAANTTAPVFLFGESFGALQVIATAFDQEHYKVKIAGVISSGGLLRLGDQFLPPWPVVKFLIFLAKYYPKIIMPATDFESTFDEAFADKEWARTARADPKITLEIKGTIGAIAATVGTGAILRAKAKEFPTKLYAVHGKGDIRSSCPAMEEFVDRIGPNKATINVVDTEGHQLLQDKPEVVKDIVHKIKKWVLETLKET